MSSCLLSSSDAVEEAGVRKAICGYTWPGIEFGEPPSCPYTYFEYVDTVRFGDMSAFNRIEAESQGWWFPTLDRGAGALLHFAVDHGRLEMVKFLLNERGAEVSQRSIEKGWTPLHRCAYVAHYKSGPFLEIFDCLLAAGADPALRTFAVGGEPNQGVLDLAVEKGDGWGEGEVRRELAALIKKHSAVPKKPEFMYRGPSIGPEAEKVLRAWEALPKLYPPKTWRPLPPSGYEHASSWQKHTGVTSG